VVHIFLRFNLRDCLHVVHIFLRFNLRDCLDVGHLNDVLRQITGFVGDLMFSSLIRLNYVICLGIFLIDSMSIPHLIAYFFNAVRFCT
jgi:hypothetical protein